MTSYGQPDDRDIPAPDDDGHAGCYPRSQGIDLRGAPLAREVDVEDQRRKYAYVWRMRAERKLAREARALLPKPPKPPKRRPFPKLGNWTVQEVAWHTRHQSQWVLRMIRTGKLGAVKLGGRWMIPKADLDLAIRLGRIVGRR